MGSRWSGSIVLVMVLGSVGSQVLCPAGHTQTAQAGERDEALSTMNRLSAEVQNLYYEGKYQDAVIIAQRILAMSDQVLGPEHQSTVESLDRLAFIYKYMAQYEGALQLYQRALAIREKVSPEHPDTARSLNNLAGLYSTMNQDELALPLAQRALEINEKALGREHPDRATSLYHLAKLYHALGQYERALPLAQEALKIDEHVLPPVHPDKAKALNNLARVYQSLGQYEQALPLYQQALAIHEKALGPEHPDTAVGLNNLADIYLTMGQHDRALPLTQQALSIQEKVLGPKHPHVAASLNNLAAVYQIMGQYQQAVMLYQRALEIDEESFGRAHPQIVPSLINLGALYRTLGDYDRGISLHQRAFRIVLCWDNPAEVATVAGRLGDLYQERNQPGTAVFYYKLAVNASQRLRQGAKSLSQDLQHSLTRTVEEKYRILARLLIAEARLAEAEQVLAMLKEEEQFEFVRRDPTDDPRHTRATLSSTEKVLADRLAENARALASVYAEIETTAKRSVPPTREWQKQEQLRERLAIESERFDQILKHVEQQFLTQRKDDLARELAELSKSVGTVRDTLAALHDVTGARPAVVYFLPAENSTTFLVTTKDGPFSLQGGVGEKQLNEAITKLREAIINRDPSYRDKAANLYEALIAPIEPELKTAQVDTLMLYLVDALRYLPFATLYDTEARRHLVEKYALTFYTAAAQANLKELSTHIWSAAALGVSKPKGQFAALPAVIDELNRVVRVPQDGTTLGILPGSRYSDELFTRQQLMHLLDGDNRYPVIHVATHFKLAPGNEGESFLLLGDGELTLREIRTDQGIKLRGFDLVTLSACETAMGGGLKGVEVEGLGVTLQNKGAKSVLATLWNVQDEGTAKFMEEFYRARGEERHTTKADALRQAQLALLTGRVKANNPKLDLTHPYYWAPFVLMGNWL